MTTTVLSTVPPVTSFEVEGYGTITQAGVSVDDSAVPVILRLAAAEGVTIIQGGTAEDITVSGANIYNPGTGSPAHGGPYTRGQMCTDSAGSLFVCITGGSPGTWQGASGTGGSGGGNVDGGTI